MANGITLVDALPESVGSVHRSQATPSSTNRMPIGWQAFTLNFQGDRPHPSLSLRWIEPPAVRIRIGGPAHWGDVKMVLQRAGYGQT